MGSSKRKTTKSALSLAAAALAVGRHAFSTYSNANSPHLYTQPQLFALLAVRQFLRLDYRGLCQTLTEWSDLRTALDLEKVPHYTTLQKAEARLLKKTAQAAWMPASIWPASAAG